MKTTKSFITLLFFILTVGSLAQHSTETLNPPLGLTFGQSKEQAKLILNTKGGTIDPEYCNAEQLCYDRIRIGTFQSSFIIARFVDNKLWDVDVYFVSDPESKTFDLFHELRMTLTSKYGTPNRCKSEFNGIYKDGDGYELLAVKAGYADICCVWAYMSNSMIMLTIPTSLAITLSYIDGALAVYVDIKQGQKNNNDF